MVAGEKSGVDFNSRDGAGCHAETDDNPVEWLGVVTAGFPAVVPGTGEDEFGSVLDGGLGVDEVGGVGEPFVGAGEDLATEGC